MEKKYFFGVLLSVFLIVLIPGISAGEVKSDLSEIISQTPANEEISVMIVFESVPQPAEISIIQSDGASIRYQYEIINAVAAKVPGQAAEKIANRAFVKLVEPDYEVKLVLDDSVSQIQADRVWEAGATGKNIDVAVLDTGIHNEHPALTVEMEVDYTGEGTDDLHGHGTYVAGIIASTDSTYRGVAYDADLFNVKVLNQEGRGFGSDVIKGIEWAIENGAEIISISFGAEIDVCDGTDSISQAVDEAVRSGVVVSIAAGNSGPDAETISTPACSKEGIAVGAVDGDDNVPNFSSRGPTSDGRVKPDLVAPGISITSTWKDNSFRTFSGTSASAPHVSGVIALLLEVDPSLNPKDIKNILKSNAFDLGLDENTQGAGRVDAYGSYLFLTNTTGETRNETEETPEEEKESENESSRFNAGINPGNVFYGLDRLFERIGLALEFDPLEKAKLHIKYSEERLAEAQILAEEGDVERAQEIISDYEENLENSRRISEIAMGLGDNTTTVNELIAEATSIHLKVLGDIYNKVPEQARPSIEQAIENSARGRAEAINALNEDSIVEDEQKTEDEEIEEKVETEDRNESDDKNLDKVLNGLEDPAKTKIKEVQERVKSEAQKSTSSSTSGSGASSNSARGRP
ncbi:MAG: S8 family serine peptidase [Candidatus Pacearchaeota archaeon]